AGEYDHHDRAGEHDHHDGPGEHDHHDGPGEHDHDDRAADDHDHHHDSADHDHHHDSADHDHHQHELDHHHDPPAVRADRHGAADLGDLPDDEPRTDRSDGREGLYHQCEHQPLRHLHQRRRLRRGDGHVRADALGRRGGCDAADADGHHDLHRDRGHLRR